MATHLQVQNAKAIKVVKREFSNSKFYTTELQIITTDSAIPTVITIFSLEPIPVTEPLSETPIIEIT